MITQFVNNGTDLEVLNKSYESMPIEQQEEIAKALKKDGLVLVDVQVNGKHGVYTRKQWKKASDVKKDKGKSSTKEKKEEPASNNDKQDNGNNPYPDYVNKTHVGVPKTHSSTYFNENNAIEFAKQLHDNGATNIEISSSVDGWGQTKYRVAWDKEEKKQSNVKTANKPAKVATPSKAKQDSSSNVSVPKTKADIQSMIASGKSRNDIIELAKKSGISWKENDHEGINWMRCCMALTASNKTKVDSTNNKATKSVAPKDIPSRSNPVFLGDALTKRIKRNPKNTGVFQTGKDSFIVDNGQASPDEYTRTEFINTFGVDPMSSKKAIKATDEEWAAGEKYHEAQNKAKAEKEAKQKADFEKDWNKRIANDSTEAQDKIKAAGAPDTALANKIKAAKDFDTNTLPKHTIIVADDGTVYEHTCDKGDNRIWKVTPPGKESFASYGGSAPSGNFKVYHGDAATAEKYEKIHKERIADNIKKEQERQNTEELEKLKGMNVVSGSNKLIKLSAALKTAIESSWNAPRGKAKEAKAAIKEAEDKLDAFVKQFGKDAKIKITNKDGDIKVRSIGLASSYYNYITDDSTTVDIYSK